MTGVGIGTSNRGLFDREDSLYVKPNALKSNVTAQEAEAFARSNAGAEAIIKNDDGTYSVYQMETSEAGKTVTNEDFKGDAIKLTGDVGKQMSGKKAYVMTTDNVIRSLEIKGIELPSVEHKFGNANVSLELSDKDGIETKSKNDLEGVLSGNISISKESLQYSLAQASKATGMGFKLDVDPAKNEYRITVSKGVNLGYVTLKMDQGGINAKFDLSGVVNAAGYAVSPIGMAVLDPEAIITDVIRNKLSKDIGMKADTVSRNEIRMTPDFKNNKMISKIPVGDMNINIEGVKANNMNFKVDGRGDLKIDLGRTVVTGSSDGNAGQFTGVDAEGADKITSSVSATLGNDLSADIKTNSSIQVNITDEEKATLAARMEKLSGMGVSVGGNAKISDIKVDAKLDNGKFSITDQQSGKISAENLSVGMGAATLKIASAKGDLSVTEEGKKVTVNAQNVEVKGGLESPDTSVDFKKLALNGKVVYDGDNPSKIRIEGDKTKGVTLSMDVKDKAKKTTVAVDEFNIKGTDVEVDMAKRNISLKPQDQNAAINIDHIKMGDNVNLNKVMFKGNMDINAFTGKIVLDSKALAFNGKLGDIQVNNLSASGKMTYDPNSGIKIEGLNLQNASGKIGNFDVSKIKAKGEINFDKEGNLSLASVSSFQLDSKSGLKASGNAVVKHNNGVFDFTVSPNKPFNVTYRPDKKEQALVSGQFEGNLKYDSNNNSFSFNNANKPFKVKQGSIAGTEFKNFSMNGEVNIGNDGIVTLNNSKGPTVISGSVAGINLKELKSEGPITVDSKNKSVNMNGNVSVELPDQKLKISTTGNVTLNQRPDGKIILDSKDGTVTGKIGSVDLENFKVQGKVIFDPKTGNINLEGQDANPFKVSGKVFGKSVDLESAGVINISKENGSTKIASQGVSLKGTIEGFNIESKEGVKGDITLSPKGELVGVKNLNLDFNIDGVSIKNTGGVNVNENGYQLKLDGQIAQDPGKIAGALKKLAESSMVPESSKASILQAQENLNKINLQNIKYENLTVDFGKDFSFNNLSVTAKELNLTYPEKDVTLNAKGSITFEMDKAGKMAITSKDEIINAKMAGTEYKDFKLNGRMEYEPESGKIAFKGLMKQDVTLSGKINNKPIEIASNAAVNFHRNGDDLEFSGEQMNLRGNIDGFKFESVGPASGKFLLKSDGHVDLSNLKCNFKVDDVIISNKQGSVKGDGESYTIKLGGDLKTSEPALLKLLDKISNNSATPDAAKQVIKESLRNIKNYQIVGNIKNASYDNFIIKVDRSLNVLGFDVDMKMKMDNTSINMGLGANRANKVNLGSVDVRADVRGMGPNFAIRNGSVSFNLTPDVKKSMGEEVKNIMAVYGLKDMDVTVNDDGSIKINKATYDGLPIVDVNIAATAKFEGTKFHVTIDKAEIKGFFGRVAQKIAEGVGGFDSRALGVRETVKRMEGMKVNYNDGDKDFSIDFKELMYQNIGENFELKNLGFKDGRFNMDYDVVIGETKPYNPSKVVDGTNAMRNIITRNKKEERENLKNLILRQEPQDLSRIMDKVTIIQVKNYLKDNDKIVAVMNKFAQNQNVGHNAQHLKELATFANDDVALAFANSLTEANIKNMSVQTKATLIKTLAKGNTNAEEEEAMKKLLLGTEQKDMKSLVAAVGANLIKDELDAQVYNQIMALAR